MTKQELDAIREDIDFARKHEVCIEISHQKLGDLLSEIDRLTSYFSPVEEKHLEQECIIDSLRSEIDRLQVERDAAVADLTELAEDSGATCGYCKKLPCYPQNDKCIGFEWRGLEGRG